MEVLYGSDSMMVEEFRLISAQLRMNRPVELLLLDLGERSGLDEIRNFAQVFAVAKRSGGELVGVINHTAGVIRDQIQVQEEILTMTAKRQMEQRIMNGLPFFLILYMELSSPGFFGLMYETGLGRMVMTVCLAVYLAAFEMAKRILQIPI